MLITLSPHPCSTPPHPHPSAAVISLHLIILPYRRNDQSKYQPMFKNTAGRVKPLKMPFGAYKKYFIE